jgi:hypothetical protein
MSKSGLQYFSDGQQVEAANDAAPAAPAAPLIYGQPAAGTKPARYAVPTPKGGVPVPSSILEDMEKIYQQKVAAKDPFGEWIKDVLAWGGTGRRGSTLESLSKRRESKEAEAAELFRMRSDMAAVRAQQEQAKNTRAYLQGRLGSGAQGTAQPGSSNLTPIPPNIAAKMQFLMSTGRDKEAEDLEKEWLKTQTTESIKREQHPDYNVPNVEVAITDPQTGESKIEMVSRRMIDQNPDLYLPTGKAAPVQAPTAAPAAPAPAPAATPAAPPRTAAPSAEAAPKNFTYDEFTPEDKQALEQSMRNLGIDPRDSVTREGAGEVFNRAPLEVRKRIFDDIRAGQPPIKPREPKAEQPSVGTMTPEAAPAAPETPAAPAAPATRKSLPEIKSEMEVRKQTEVAAAQAKIETDKKMREQFNQDTKPLVITERLSRANRVAKLVSEDPTIAGVISGPGYRNAISGLLASGVTTPTGSISISKISDAIYKTLPTTIDTKKRYELAGILANMELDASAVMNGQGQISDGERKILEKASISIDDPAEVVYKKAKMMIARQETLRQLSEIYGDGSKYIRNFDAFKNDPRYKKIEKEYEARLEKIMAEDVKLEKKMPVEGKGSAKPASRAFSDPDKERRYQEYLRSRRGS